MGAIIISLLTPLILIIDLSLNLELFVDEQGKINKENLLIYLPSQNKKLAGN